MLSDAVEAPEVPSLVDQEEQKKNASLLAWLISPESRQQARRLLGALQEAEDHLRGLLSRLLAAQKGVEVGLERVAGEVAEERRQTQERIAVLTVEVRDEVAAILEATVALCNRSADRLPPPVRNLLRGVLLSLPRRLSAAESVSMLLSEAIALLRSLGSILATFIHFGHEAA